MVDDDLTPEGEDGDDTVVLENEEAERPEAVDEQPSEPPSIEALAAKMGWSPKDQWRGDPDKWRPADDFIVTTVDVNRGLVSKLDNVERQLETMSRTSAKLTERAVQQERERLLKERQEAFEVSDSEAFNSANQKLNELEQQVPQNDGPTPEGRAFMERNAGWFGKDQEATGWFYNRCNELMKQGIGPARQIQIAEREGKQMFPELFGEPAEQPKPKAAPLNKPGARGASTVKKGFATLPAHAQKAALEFEKAGKCTRDEYADVWHAEAEEA